ncbi:MAG: Rdx family protein [Anaerolineales bacterium]
MLESKIESFTLIPSDGGRFEFSVDGELVFSKLQLGRHADEGEVIGLFKKHLGVA